MNASGENNDKTVDGGHGGLAVLAVADLAISVFNNVQLARRILARQEAAVENQRLARHEGSAIRAHP